MLCSLSNYMQHISSELSSRHHFKSCVADGIVHLLARIAATALEVRQTMSYLALIPEQLCKNQRTVNGHSAPRGPGPKGSRKLEAFHPEYQAPMKDPLHLEHC